MIIRFRGLVEGICFESFGEITKGASSSASLEFLEGFEESGRINVETVIILRLTGVLRFIVSGVRVEFLAQLFDSGSDGGYRHGGGEPSIGCVVIVNICSHLSSISWGLSLDLGASGAFCMGIVVELLDATCTIELEAALDNIIGAELGVRVLGVENQNVKDEEQFPEGEATSLPLWSFRVLKGGGGLEDEFMEVMECSIVRLLGLMVNLAPQAGAMGGKARV